MGTLVLLGLLMLLTALSLWRAVSDLSLTASITDNNSGLTFALAQALAVTQAGSNKRSTGQDAFLVNTSDTTIPLGTVGTLGYMIAENLDPTNPVDLKNQAAGTIIARLDAGGGVAMFKIGSGITAPVAIATTAACRIRFRIWEA